MYKYINSSFFKRYNFSKPIRYWNERDQQFKIYYEIEGYDSTILVAPFMQVVPNGFDIYGKGFNTMPPEIQVEEFSNIELLENHHINSYSIYINSFDNHLISFSYEYEIIQFFNLIKCPLKPINSNQ